MLELLPGIGVVLPDGAGTLGFGMTAEEAGAMLAATPGSHRSRQCMTLTRRDYAELRHAHDAWLGGILFDHAWNTVASFGGLVLTVAAGGPGRDDRLTLIAVEADASARTAATPEVVWDGIDLFGHPARDVVSVLPGPIDPSRAAAGDVTVPRLGLWLRRPPPAADRWSRLTLLDTPTGWDRCCAGTFACARGGDGLVGVLR
ncbi:hypothetical protein ACFVFS_06330 [Kitasatospora sp. NPDC057692]|uniref:hypothetical protein n=1 Tax=Kitasatospora sp. NPDC057692 TaxID=3346215 RepID=UPI003699E5A6